MGSQEELFGQQGMPANLFSVINSFALRILRHREQCEWFVARSNEDCVLEDWPVRGVTVRDCLMEWPKGEGKAPTFARTIGVRRLECLYGP